MSAERLVARSPECLYKDNGYQIMDSCGLSTSVWSVLDTAPPSRRSMIFMQEACKITPAELQMDARCGAATKIHLHALMLQVGASKRKGSPCVGYP